MFEKLISHYKKVFSTPGKDGYYLIAGSVCVSVMNDEYRKMVKNGVVPYENLPFIRRIKILRKCIEYKSSRIHISNAAKAAYTLELISANV